MTLVWLGEREWTQARGELLRMTLRHFTGMKKPRGASRAAAETK